DGRFLDRAVHALDLTIGPRMLDLGQPMFDAILLAAQIEHMCRVSCRRAVRVSWWESELDPIIGEDRVDLVWAAAIRASRNAAAEVLAVFLTSCTNANLLVRSIAT